MTKYCDIPFLLIAVCPMVYLSAPCTPIIHQDGLKTQNGYVYRQMLVPTSQMKEANKTGRYPWSLGTSQKSH